MSQPTVWQLGHLWVTDWRSASPELIGPYRDLGYKAVQVHLEDGGEVPLDYCNKLRALGFTVFGCFWPKPDKPREEARWAVSEAKRLRLRGIIVNAEDEIEGEDAIGNKWSQQFCSEFRLVAPGMGLALNTYSGCGWIDHAAWRKANARLYMQTFPGGGAGFSENVPYVVSKAAEWGWGKARVKPCFGVYKTDGVRPDPAEMIASAKAAGTKGFTAFYADGTFDVPEYMAELAKGFGSIAY